MTSSLLLLYSLFFHTHSSILVYLHIKQIMSKPYVPQSHLIHLVQDCCTISSFPNLLHLSIQTLHYIISIIQTSSHHCISSSPATKQPAPHSLKPSAKAITTDPHEVPPRQGTSLYSCLLAIFQGLIYIQENLIQHRPPPLKSYAHQGVTSSFFFLLSFLLLLLLLLFFRSKQFVDYSYSYPCCSGHDHGHVLAFGGFSAV